MAPTLNDDVMLEILHWFVSLDDLGPYTLFHVSNAWRATLLQTPSLWTWITIDVLYNDLEQRVRMSIHMSGSLSLRFRIKIRSGPWQKVDWLKPFLPRADVLIMQLPESRRKVISHDMVFRRMRSFLTGTEWNPALRVIWMRDGAVEGVKRNSLVHRTYWLNPSKSQSGTPLLLNLLTTRIGIDSPHWQGQNSITTLISAMRNLSELRLYDSPANSPETGSYESREKPIHLYPLRVLQIGTSKGKAIEEASGSCDYNLRFADYLKVEVEHLTIQDHLECIISTISHIGSYIQPDTLTLYPQDLQCTSSLTMHSPLNKLFRLNVDLAEFTQVISEEGFPVMAEAIYSVIVNIPTIRICQLVLTPCTFSYGYYFLSLHQKSSRDIKFEVSVYEKDKKVRVVPWVTEQPPAITNTILDKYELRSGNLRYAGRFCTRSLIIKTRWECQRVSTTLTSLLVSPDGNYSHLQFLDTGRVKFKPEDEGDRRPGLLPSLTVVRSVPEVVVCFLRAFSTPALQKLTLVDNIYAGDGNSPDHRAVADLLGLLGLGGYQYLRDLTFQFYPHWIDLLGFLASWCSDDNKAEYHLALPSYPSRLILALLVGALRNETSIKDPILPREPCSFNEFKEGQSDRRAYCYYCFCSHRTDCVGDSTVACMRHSKDAPIEITKYSLM